MHWELWDTESANLVEDFATEDEALQAVREILAANRPDYIDALALGAMYDEGESREEELPPGLSGAELQSRLAQSTEEALADAARSVHDRIRNWLTEEGWHIEEIADQNKRFNAMVTMASGAHVNIYQNRSDLDRIAIAVRWIFEGEFKSEIASLPHKIQSDLVKAMYRDAAMLEIEFDGFELPPHDLRYYAYMYFDAVTKDALIHRVRRAIRAVTLSMWEVARVLEESGGSSEATVAFLHIIRGVGGESTAGGPVTVAS